jgi:hypothetical protein
MRPDGALCDPLDRAGPLLRKAVGIGPVQHSDGGRRPPIVRRRRFHDIDVQTSGRGLTDEDADDARERDPAFRRAAPAGEEEPRHRRFSRTGRARFRSSLRADLLCAVLNVTSGQNVATTRASRKSTRSAITHSMAL